MIKKLQRSEDVFIQFTDDELQELNIKPNDKFTVKAFDDGSFTLTKFANIEIDLSEFDRETLEHIIQISCDEDISVNEVISNILEKFVKQNDLDKGDENVSSTKYNVNHEEVEFNINCKMKERWVPHFLGMLKYMEQLGGLGGSRKVSIYSDGDGDFRPKFNFDIVSELAKPVSDDNGDRLYDAGLIWK